MASCLFFFAISSTPPLPSSSLLFRVCADAVETVTLAKFIEDTDLCVVCSDSLKDVVFRPCRHLCACTACGALVQQCPMCRADVEDRVHIILA
jgi:hypothetical protein